MAKPKGKVKKGGASRADVKKASRGDRKLIAKLGGVSDG